MNRTRLPLRHPGLVGVPPQRWAVVAAWTAFLSAIPPVLWRLAMLAGAPVGFADAAQFREDPELFGYVLGLVGVETLAAVLCLGLVRRWGEVVPRWIPVLGGRTIHRLLPTVLGAAGVVALVWFVAGMAVSFGSVWLGLADGWTPDAGMTTGQTLLLAASYGWLPLWPVALKVALVGYWRRRSRPDPGPATRPTTLP